MVHNTKRRRAAAPQGPRWKPCGGLWGAAPPTVHGDFEENLIDRAPGLEEQWPKRSHWTESPENCTSFQKFTVNFQKFTVNF